MEQSSWNAWLCYFLLCCHIYSQSKNFIYKVANNLLFVLIEKSYQSLKMSENDKIKNSILLDINALIFCYHQLIEFTNIFINTFKKC